MSEMTDADREEVAAMAVVLGRAQNEFMESASIPHYIKHLAEAAVAHSSRLLDAERARAEEAEAKALQA